MLFSAIEMTMKTDQQTMCSKIFDLVDRDKSGFIDKNGKITNYISCKLGISFMDFRIRILDEMSRIKI